MRPLLLYVTKKILSYKLFKYVQVQNYGDRVLIIYISVFEPDRSMFSDRIHTFRL